MKAKAIFAAGLLMAAAAAQSTAQTVYSVNAVGFVNVVIPPGFSILANPLEGATNTVAALFPSVPNTSVIFKFTGSTFSQNTYFLGWDFPNQTLVPGEAFFIKNAGAAFTNTFVGNVKQGVLTTSLSAGFSMVSSQVPQQGLVSTDLGLPISNTETVFTYNNAANRYDIFTFFLGWDPVEPTIQVGQGFFVKKNSPGSWSRTFSVNQ